MTDVDGSQNLSDRNSDGDRAAVELPTHVLERVEARVAKTDFESTSEYVTYVLEHVLGKVESRNETPAESVDSEEVEDRLESLGYLD